MRTGAVYLGFGSNFAIVLVLLAPAPVFEHPRVRSIDWLGRVKIPAILDGCAGSEKREGQSGNNEGGFHFSHVEPPARKVSRMRSF